MNKLKKEDGLFLTDKQLTFRGNSLCLYRVLLDIISKCKNLLLNFEIEKANIVMKQIFAFSIFLRYRAISFHQTRLHHCMLTILQLVFRFDRYVFAV